MATILVPCVLTVLCENTYSADALKTSRSEKIEAWGYSSGSKQRNSPHKALLSPSPDAHDRSSDSYYIPRREESPVSLNRNYLPAPESDDGPSFSSPAVPRQGFRNLILMSPVPPLTLLQNGYKDIDPERAFIYFLQAGENGEALGYYEAGCMVLIGDIENTYSAESLFEKSVELSYVSTLDHEMPIGLVPLIDIKFTAASQKLDFRAYQDFLEKYSHFEYVQYKLGQINEKLFRPYLAIESYQKSGTYGRAELSALGQ